MNKTEQVTGKAEETRPERTPEQQAAVRKAQEAHQQYAAERALNNRIRLRMAARIFRAARARGLVDADGNVLADIEQAEAS